VPAGFDRGRVHAGGQEEIVEHEEHELLLQVRERAPHDVGPRPRATSPDARRRHVGRR
jgi:hypothetical protein